MNHKIFLNRWGNHYILKLASDMNKPPKKDGHPFGQQLRLAVGWELSWAVTWDNVTCGFSSTEVSGWRDSFHGSWLVSKCKMTARWPILTKPGWSHSFTSLALYCHFIDGKWVTKIKPDSWGRIQIQQLHGRS